MTVIDKIAPYKSKWKGILRNGLMGRCLKKWTLEKNFLRNSRNQDSILIKNYIKNKNMLP